MKIFPLNYELIFKNNKFFKDFTYEINATQSSQINLNEAEYDEALDFIDESIDIFEEINNKVKLADTQLLKIRILIKMDKLKKYL